MSGMTRDASVGAPVQHSPKKSGPKQLKIGRYIYQLNRYLVIYITAKPSYSYQF